jgi:hypothetical protein
MKSNKNKKKWEIINNFLSINTHKKRTKFQNLADYIAE